MVTTQTADNVLKSYYLDAIAETLDKNANPFFAAIQKTTSDVWGRDVRKNIRVGMNGGIGAGTEEGDLPASKGNRYAQIVAPLKNLYGTIEISDKAIRASAGNEGAFVNLLNDEMDGLVKSSSFNFGRMLFGDGTGTLATVKTAGSTDAVFDTVQNLAEGMVVDVYGSNKSRKNSALTVEEIDRDQAKIKLSQEITFEEGDFLVVQNSYGLELTGLKAIFSQTGSLYGLNKEDYFFLKPRVYLSVGALSEEIVQKAIDTAEETYGGKHNLIVTSMGVRRAMLKDLAYNRFFEPNHFDAGFQYIKYSGIPVIADRFCPANTAYVINTDDFGLHQLCDWQWLEGEDGKILKQVPGKPVYTATLVKYAELICYRPCGQVMLSGIAEAS